MLSMHPIVTDQAPVYVWSYGQCCYQRAVQSGEIFLSSILSLSFSSDSPSLPSEAMSTTVVTEKNVCVSEIQHTVECINSLTTLYRTLQTTEGYFGHSWSLTLCMLKREKKKNLRYDFTLKECHMHAQTHAVINTTDKSIFSIKHSHALSFMQMRSCLKRREEFIHFIYMYWYWIHYGWNWSSCYDSTAPGWGNVWKNYSSMNCDETENRNQINIWGIILEFPFFRLCGNKFQTYIHKLCLGCCCTFSVMANFLPEVYKPQSLFRTVMELF